MQALPYFLLLYFFFEKPHTNWKFEHVLHRWNKLNGLNIWFQIHKINLVKNRGQSICLLFIAADAFTCNSVQRIWYISHLLLLLFWNKIDFAFSYEVSCIYICWWLFSCCLTTGRSVCASRNQYVYFVAFFSFGMLFTEEKYFKQCYSLHGCCFYFKVAGLDPDWTKYLNTCATLSPGTIHKLRSCMQIYVPGARSDPEKELWSLLYGFWIRNPVYLRPE